MNKKLTVITPIKHLTNVEIILKSIPKIYLDQTAIYPPS